MCVKARPLLFRAPARLPQSQTNPACCLKARLLLFRAPLMLPQSQATAVQSSILDACKQKTNAPKVLHVMFGPGDCVFFLYRLMLNQRGTHSKFSPLNFPFRTRWQARCPDPTRQKCCLLLCWQLFCSGQEHRCLQHHRLEAGTCLADVLQTSYHH